MAGGEIEAGATPTSMHINPPAEPAPVESMDPSGPKHGRCAGAEHVAGNTTPPNVSRCVCLPHSLGSIL